VRDWLRYEAGIRAEQRRIARRRARAPQRPSARRGKTIAETPRWLASLNLGLGALVLAQKVAPAWWIGFAFTLCLLAVIVVAVWKILVIALLVYLAVRVAARVIGSYFAYRRDSAEIPF
jgi:hypothetical protein